MSRIKVLKYTVLACLSGLFLNQLSSQDCTQAAYFSALIHVANEGEIVAEIKKIFPEFTRKRSPSIDLKVSNRIEYIPIYGIFTGCIDSTTLNRISRKEETLSPSHYDNNAEFKGYKLDFLSETSMKNDSPLVIRFSAVQNGYVALEILDGTMNLGKFRYGKVVQILLVFDKNYIITETYITTRVYS